MSGRRGGRGTDGHGRVRDGGLGGTDSGRLGRCGRPKLRRGRRGKRAGRGTLSRSRIGRRDDRPRTADEHASRGGTGEREEQSQ